MNQRDHVDQSMDLGKYFRVNDQDHREDQLAYNRKNFQSEQIIMQIKRINMMIYSLFPQRPQRLGDLTSNSSKQQQKTVQLVQFLINQIKKLQEIKSRLTNQRRQVEQNLVQSDQTKQKLQREKKNLDNQKQNIFQKFKNLQKTYKEAVEKSQNERQDLMKQIRQLQQRQKGFEAQFRKKQNTIKSLQDNIKKFQEKKTNFINSFDVIQKLEYGPNIYELYSTNGENEYGRIAKETRDEVFKKLAQENQYLKESLSNIYKQLNTVLQLKKQTLKNKKGYDGEYQNFFELNNFRPETLYLPEQWSRERLKQLNENIHKFKQAIKVGDYSNSRIDQRKQSCVAGIKKLITNYKQVVETQDQMLSKVLLKSKQFKAAELNHLQNKFSKVLDNSDIDRAKRFVQQQAQYLETKNIQLEKTRKMMQAVMRKAEQANKQSIKQRQNFQQQALQVRKLIQVLPAMVQQQLGKALD